MHSDSYSDDSDSSSLPDLSKIFQDPPSSISTGDIVWAKYKHLFWPALVRTVYPKQKKISIWYTDEPGKTFKLPLKNICLFHDAARRAEILKDVREAGFIREHEGLTSHARKYLLRKAQGFEDDPMKFFDQTYPFFLVEKWQQKNPGADVSDIKIPPLYITPEKKRSIRKRIHARKVVSDDSEVESTDSEGEHGEKTVTADYLTKVNVHLQENRSDPSNNEYVDKIVECILSGKADDYLKKIMLKRIPSEHQDLYEKSLKRSKKSCSNITYTGPVEDDDKLRKLIFYLLPLYDNMGKSKHSAYRKCKTEISTRSSSKKKSDGAQFVASVWLPESIIFGISVIKNVSLHEAKQLFKEKSECKTRAVESILASLDSLFPETDCISKSGDTGIALNDDKNGQPEAVKHSSDIETCSPLKKMRVYRSETAKDNEIITKGFEFSLKNSELHDDLKSVAMSDTIKHNVSRSDNGAGHTSEASDTIKHNVSRSDNGAGHTSKASNRKCDIVLSGKSSKRVPRRNKK